MRNLSVKSRVGIVKKIMAGKGCPKSRVDGDVMLGASGDRGGKD